MQQGTGDRDPLDQPPGELAERLTRSCLEVERGELVSGPRFRVGQAIEPGREAQVLLRGQVVVEQRRVGEKPHLPAGLRVSPWRALP